MGLTQQLFSWIWPSLWTDIPKEFEKKICINSFDIDGVIYLNDEVGGIYPGPDDVIITGRSFEEIPETRAMLQARGISNRVFFNQAKFDDKTRHSSGVHKAETIKELESLGLTIMCHFEDDEIQAAAIKKLCPNVTVVMVVHDLTTKENVRHTKEIINVA